MPKRKHKIRRNCVVILHNIRSTHNVGSIFRTCDAAGIDKIYLTGYTPAPIDRFGRPVKEISKTALGSDKFVPWEHVTSINRLIKVLKTQNFKIISVEQSKRSKDYKKTKLSEKAAFIFGNEVSGLPSSLLKNSDYIIEVPMKGSKESLNVSVAAGIVLFRILGV